MLAIGNVHFDGALADRRNWQHAGDREATTPWRTATSTGWRRDRAGAEPASSVVVLRAAAQPEMLSDPCREDISDRLSLTVDAPRAQRANGS
jgi:hypothetical protein